MGSGDGGRGSVELGRIERERLGREALAWALRYFEELATLPVYPDISAAELQRSLTESLPLDPQDIQSVFGDFVAKVVPGCRHNNHPRMFGYISSSANFVGAIGDFAASVLNQNVTSWRSAPAATTIELTVVEWIKQIIGAHASAVGLLTSGGSMANFSALAAALRWRTGIDVAQDGVRALSREPVIYASTLVHLSIPKAAALLGLGRKSVRRIETLPDGSLDLAKLDAAIHNDLAAGRQPLCVVLNAGDVNTGAFDPIEAAVNLCAGRHIWCHVDASYGGFAALAPGIRPRFVGIDRADSIALDPHKWLFVPLDAGCLLARDPAALRRAFEYSRGPLHPARGATWGLQEPHSASEDTSYVDVIATPEMSEFAFWDYGLDLSRRFRALKIWMLLKHAGTRALGDAIQRNIELATRLGALIAASDDFELLAPVGLSIVCFRYRPRARLAEEELDSLNRRLLVAVQRRGVAYLSNAVVNGRFALRACLVNFRTEDNDLEILIDEIRRAARNGAS